MIRNWITGKKLTFAVRKSEGADRRYWFEGISGEAIAKSLSDDEMEHAALEGIKIAIQGRLRRLPDDTLEKIATRVEFITGGKNGKKRDNESLIEAFKPSESSDSEAES